MPPISSTARPASSRSFTRTWRWNCIEDARVRPDRRPVTGRTLEGKMERRVRALADRGRVRVGEDDGPPGEAAVERRELGRVAAFEDDAAQLADPVHDRVIPRSGARKHRFDA